MASFQAKHVVERIDGTRCSVIESAAPASRVEFLKSLLTFNGYTVIVAPDGDQTWKIGVTDVLFHAVIEVYKRKLHTPNGHIVTPAYWLQLTQEQSEKQVNYWNH